MHLRTAAAAAIALAGLYATPSFAGYGGFYLATFTAPGHPATSYCFELTPTNTDPTYTYSGTFAVYNHPNTHGTYVVSKHGFHMAGQVDHSPTLQYLAVDGIVAGGTLHGTTFDYFYPTGYFIAAGSFVVSTQASCTAAGG